MEGRKIAGVRKPLPGIAASQTQIKVRTRQETCEWKAGGMKVRIFLSTKRK